jgi:hypothetical protein
MRSALVFYDPTDGRILTSGSYAEIDIELNRPTPEAKTIEADNANQGTQYVLDGALTDRPEMALSGMQNVLEVNEEMVITGIPVGTVVHHADGELIVDDDLLEWASNVPGVFYLRILNFPYQEVFLCVSVKA